MYVREATVAVSGAGVMTELFTTE
ncbi:Protein of unknown function [Weissella confusa LBAE C39-2]|nr:Protein of unknown function [Weissella confusa LBAE C39-2]